ncbi:MAG: ABC transporter ATP-binding protein/permease [Alphaproteobacteria bacterium]
MSLDSAVPDYDPENFTHVPPAGWRAFFRDFFRLAGAYWNSERKWAARGWTAALVLLTGGQVVVQIALNLWIEQLFDAFGTRSMAGFVDLALVFAVIVVSQVAVTSIHLRLRRRLQVAWRDWLTAKLLGGWLASGRQYLLDFVGGAHDNPDGRIAEDIRIATEYAVDLVHSLFYCLLLFFSFASILWTLSGEATLRLDGVEFWLPGHLLWAAILYAAIGTVIALLLGPPMVRAAEARQSREADFRFGLGRVRQSALAVALLHGEADERRHLRSLFGDAVSAWDRQTAALTSYTMFTASWAVLSPIFPVLIAAPRYMIGAITLGALMQIAQAFQQAVSALSWPIDNLSKAAEWRASGERVLGLHAALEELRAHPAEGISVAPGATAVLALRGLVLEDPDGAAKVRLPDLVVKPGERWLISGHPGAAIRLFKTVAGLWPWGRGTIELPSDDSVFFMPQRPYLPVGSLCDAIGYPSAGDVCDRAAALAALARVGLSHLAPRLDRVEAWEQTLGASEQQRLGFARLLVHRPRWIFLQEATDQLDAASERDMLDLLAREFPASAIVLMTERGEENHAAWRRLTFVKEGGLATGRVSG